ncbi:MAG: hypothetical protein HN704_11865 [Bacteroidetes bacterium]|jgi:hypothetical protein|nr:hypothetical protein [Bacteroidota bacterium]MBT6685578.1 hypothetical protein [Bacteroidota bacterium]MBT7144466.1 hypothetical protein [Bacteroidota bacterium]MBT7492288.1 hypothetical protein [Bacteroidota bacterium]
MSDKYKIYEPYKAYFITMTTVGWLDVFTHKNHKMAIVDSLKYCQRNKGLEKLNYIYQNPVQKMIVQEPQDYLFSSARNYAELPNLIGIIVETPQLKTYV